MDEKQEKRQSKIKAAREKLKEFQKHKTGEKSESESLSQSSDTSLSLSPLPLSDTGNKPKIVKPENVHSGSSSISENIEFSSGENDRSLQEIVIGNIPLDSPDLSLTSVLLQQPEKNMIQSVQQPVPSLNNSLISDNISVISLNALEKFELDNNNVNADTQNFLDEIINDEQFDSKSESVKDDLSSVTLKSEQFHKTGCEVQTSQDNLLTNTAKSKAMPNREQLVVQISAESDSLKEVNSSNPSTISLGTSTTEYKEYYDKVNLGMIEFQDIISSRDAKIRQLTEALQQVIEDRKNLQEQTGCFAQEVADLKEQLIQTTAIIKKNNWNQIFGNELLSSDDFKESENRKRDESDSTSLKSLPVDNEMNKSKISEINFDFDDPEFNDDMSSEERKIVDDMRNKINLYIRKKVDEYKTVYESEIKILKDQLEFEKHKNIPSNKDTEDSISSLSADNKIKTAVSNLQQSTNIEINDDKFNQTFSEDELTIIADLRTKIYLFIQQTCQSYKEQHDSEYKILKDRFESEKVVHAGEIDKLRQLVTSIKSGTNDIQKLREELNAQHNKEMEELRTYFEQRCADIEKHYSEEIFSQQSRKMSASSECSELESEVFPAQPGPAGDGVNINIDPTKTDLHNLQNKYHAELEILREDYENRLDEMKINHENIVKDMEQKYRLQIDALKMDLEELQKNAVATQEVASSGDFEIAEVVESYERRLQEQVMLAKIDIISALEQQIQTLVSSTDDNIEWPSELLQLRDRLTQHWNAEIQQLKDEHSQEIVKIKEDHEKSLARALDRDRRNSLKSMDEIEHKKERDHLKKLSTNLRHLVAELIKYFTKCEDELNNTLVEELLKFSFDKDSSDLNDTSQSGSEDLLAISPRVKRVHFTPDVSGIINLIDESTLDFLDSTKDISTDFKSELDVCLERLKTEANAILALTSNLKTRSIEHASADESRTVPDQNRLSSLTRQLITETQMKNELNIMLDEQKCYIQSLEAEKQSTEVQVEQLMAKQQVLVSELDNAKEKIADLIESGRKEIVSEGYGENQITGSTTLGGRIASLAELQERARLILTEADSTKSNSLLQLIDELCREGDRIMEDAKKDHEDLVQQIEAADKKLRATTQFLEDQAIDREQERDEAQKEIAALKEQQRDGERTRASCERINKEETQDLKLTVCSSDSTDTVLETVERLESQMREMTTLMTDCETKKIEVENELKEAIDKIWVLRDIIRDLESQIEDRTKGEIDLKNVITQLEDKINFETKQNEELTNQLHLLGTNAVDNQYTNIIRQLESENQKLRVSSELVGPDGVLKQVKAQLNDFEKTIEKRTKDLEALHTVISNTNCSSPSEDMSIRDQIRPSTSSDGCESDLPLEQLARLKDKLIKHARAEDAAMKRIRDLEMQLYTAKQEFDEVQSERDVLQDQLSEQMVLISSLQLRLDEQRLRVESAQKQTNTSFEHRIYELETEIQELKDGIHKRDKTTKQLNTVIDQTKKRLSDQQKQLNSASDIEKQLVEQFQAEIDRLNTEIDQLKKDGNNVSEKLEQSAETSTSGSQTANTMYTEFLDSILAEKNADLDRLKDKLSDVETDLKFYKSLNLSKEDLISMSNLGPKSSPGVISLVSLEPDIMRRQEQSHDSIQSVENLEIAGSTFRDSKCPEKLLNPFVNSEISTIEKVCSQNSVGDAKTKHVRFNDENSEIATKLNELQIELNKKDETIKSFEEKLNSVSEYMIDIEQLRQKLQFSEDTVKQNTESFKCEIDTLKDAEKDLRVELAQAKVTLQEKEKKLEEFEKDVNRKDQMYLNLAKEKRDIEHKISELEYKINEFKSYEDIVSSKNQEIYQLEQQLAELRESYSSESLKESILEKESELSILRIDMEKLHESYNLKLQEIDKLNHLLTDYQNKLEEKSLTIAQNEFEHKNLTTQCGELSNHIMHLQETLDKRNDAIANLEQEIEAAKQQQNVVKMYEDKIQQLETTLSEQIKKSNTDQQLSCSELELEMAKNKKDLVEKELQLSQSKLVIDELKKEINHLQEYLNEKDKIIHQMTLDSNNLHSALEAIQAKIQESGNVIDLKKRLREEQNLSAALHDELKYLKQSIEQYEYQQSTDTTETLVLLKESVAREKLTNQELTNTRDALLFEIQQLKLRLQAGEEQIQKLKDALEEEKQNSNAIQLQDANLIESMRLRLEAFLNNENESEKLLIIEKKLRKDLEIQLQNLQKQSGAFSLESNLKINDANFDLTCLKMDLVKVSTENEILKSDVSTLTKSQRENEKRVKLEAESTRALLAVLEDEKCDMEKQIEELKNHLRKTNEHENELMQLLHFERNKQMEAPVPEKFVQKIKELTILLQEHIKDNKEMSCTVANLTEERKALQHYIKQLEYRLNSTTPYDDPIARADHLFGRYLKSESHRKALTYQKRYLITLLASYQRCNTVNLKELNFVLPRQQPAKNLNKFRVYAYAIISIRRMQYIVQRWHTGKRIGSSIVLKKTVPNPQTISYSSTSSSNIQNTTWMMGNSPPSRDRGISKRTQPLGNTIQEGITLAPLQAPALLTQYIERFDNIQQRLGLSLDKAGT